MADFITYTSRFLKENTIINENVDDKILTPIIIFVQDQYLHPILGTDLFNEIKAQIITPPVSSANQTLLDDYLMKVMLWYVLSESTPAMKYKYMNKGIMIKNSENSQPADLSEIKFLMDRWKNNAEMYAQRATNYLKEHTDTYPLYLLNEDCDDIQPNSNNYTTSIYLGDGDT